MNKPKDFLILTPETWAVVRELVAYLPRRAFRGQNDASFNLETTIFRGANQFGCPSNLLANRESWMLRQFQRRAHHYLDDPPRSEEEVEWLALIQHYGGPTRLLDFSYSFYVAAFFAVERSVGQASVWAVNLNSLETAIRTKTKNESPNETVDQINSSHLEIVESALRGKATQKLVVNVEPNRLNERLSIQQGLFLFPCDISSSFEQNLAATFDWKAEVFERPFEIRFAEISADLVLSATNAMVLKIVLPRDIHKSALDDLENTNITSTTLFPGLDGFARSMLYHLRALETDKDFERRWARLRENP